MMKNHLKQFIFYLVPLLILLALGEICVRLIHFNNRFSGKSALVSAYQTLRNAKYCTQFIRLREHPREAVVREKTTKEFRAHVNAGQEDCMVETDEMGFIKPSAVHHDPDVKIVFLGGSSTECFFIEEQKRFPFLTGRLLEKATGKKINTYNSGVGGNNSFHSIDLLINKVLPMQPDVVVMMHNINDWTTFLFEGSYWNNNPSRSLIVNLQGKTTGTDEWENTRGKKQQCDTAYLFREFRRSQELFVSTCRIYNIQPVLMTQASRFISKPDQDVEQTIHEVFAAYGLKYADIMFLQRHLNEIIREVAQQNNVLLVDLEKEVEGSLAMIYDQVHFTNAGSEKAARVICEKMQARLFQPVIIR